MPFVNVKLLESGATREQKAQIIEEINPDNWGNRGQLMSELRKETAKN